MNRQRIAPGALICCIAEEFVGRNESGGPGGDENEGLGRSRDGRSCVGIVVEAER